ncbi:UbiA-like protein EboC [Pseudozobellia thermophila]|uniref:4-hydroxybenzoate polyprenyltransferase n=1 Tax=Pseudozobellia thermophila TaxID=192903 RepID=A0A1M6GRW0_9FLAO|nr:UbiA-like protein EboC [Pseudozobellia thermophila]SHJ12658.1 4-hydroxybenzoate polyprenyltransferase [Pseudozobellia thermophila]
MAAPLLLAYARLARPANLPTAAADIFAGVAVGGLFASSVETGMASAAIVDALYLVFASVFLYAGGVILNDVFDYKIDKVERPERPIPSGIVSLSAASVYGGVVLAIGVLLAFLVSTLSGILAIALALSILLYDGVAKKYDFFGPLSMGLCRGLNLIMGMSLLGNLQLWWLAAIPVVYIFAITLISRGEVHGKNKNDIVLAGVLYLAVLLAVLSAAAFYTDSFLITLLYSTLFAFMVFRPLVKAYSDNSPKNIKKAVIAGVMSLIILDAAIGAAFSVWWYGLAILALLPISMALSKLFAVT